MGGGGNGLPLVERGRSDEKILSNRSKGESTRKMKKTLGGEPKRDNKYFHGEFNEDG